MWKWFVYITKLSSKINWCASKITVIFICHQFNFNRFAIISSNLLSVIIFVHLLCCASIIGFNFLLLECSDNIDLQVLSSLYVMLSDIAVNFVFCLLSEQITSALLRVGDIVYNSMWYRLPTQQQVLVTLLLQRSQEIFRLRALGIIHCSLDTFSRVMFESDQWNASIY